MNKLLKIIIYKNIGYFSFMFLFCPIYCGQRHNVFSAQQHMLSALYAIAHPSICPSVTRVDQPKTV